MARNHKKIARNRYKLRKVSNREHRLSVFRSNKNIYAQILCLSTGNIIATASSLEKDLQSQPCNVSLCAKVGELVAVRAKQSGVESVFFDRGDLPYHGKIKSLADAARDNGLSF